MSGIRKAVSAAALCVCIGTGFALAGENAAVSYEQAMDIALGQSGGGIVVESDVDRTWSGGRTYEFEIINNDSLYKVEVDGADGSIVEFKQKRDRDASRVQPRMDIAAVHTLARTTVGGGDILEYELDRDDGRLVHEIVVGYDGSRHKLEIDDSNGQIIKHRNKR